jgi:hypothetical protein
MGAFLFAGRVPYGTDDFLVLGFFVKGGHLLREVRERREEREALGPNRTEETRLYRHALHETREFLEVGEHFRDEALPARDRVLVYGKDALERRGAGAA